MMKKGIVSLIILLLLVLLAFAGYKLVYSLFDKYNDTRLDPVDFSLLKVDSTKSYDWVLLGDSHTQYWKINQQNVLNLGKTGQTSGQIKIRTELIKDQLKGKNLILSVGANDIKSVSTNPETKDKIVNDCISRTQEMISSLKPRFQKIYIITIPPDFEVGMQQRLFNYQATVDAKNQLNSKIRTLAKQNNIELIDVFTILNGKKKMSDDGVHMNTKAYEILNSHLNNTK